MIYQSYLLTIVKKLPKLLPVIKPPANVSLNAYKMLAICLWQIEPEHP